jgi:AcrR family transcriptional regulator
VSDAAEAPSRARARLSRGAILVAAMGVVDDVGLEGLTIRKVSTVLDCAPMSLYEYFDSKAAIVAGLADVVAQGLLAPLEPPVEGMSPREGVLGVMRAVRARLLVHPALVPAVVAHPLPESAPPDSWFLAEGAVETIRSAGFSDEDLPVALAVLAEVTMGLMMWETGRMTHGAQSANPPALADLIDQIGRERGSQDVRTRVLAAFMPHRADEIFDAAIGAVFDGLHTRFVSP